MAGRGHGIAAVAVLALMALSGCSQPGAQGTGGEDDGDGGLSSGTSTATSGPGPSTSGAANSTGTSMGRSSSGPSTSANQTTSTTGSNGTTSSTGTESSTSTGTDPSTSSTSSSSSSSSASGSTSSAPQYQFRLTLVNNGLTTPDAFYCYVDGSSLCDPDQTLPGPGASADYWFTTSGAPDLLQVSALYAQTWPVAQYRFTAVNPYAEILVETSEATISASCSSGCSLA